MAFPERINIRFTTVYDSVQEKNSIWTILFKRKIRDILEVIRCGNTHLFIKNLDRASVLKVS